MVLFCYITCYRLKFYRCRPLVAQWLYFGHIFETGSTTMKQYILSVLLFLITSLTTIAQDLPASRQLFHEKIDVARSRIDLLDGNKDAFYKATNLRQVNEKISRLMYNSVDELINSIEQNDSLDNNTKIKYLRGIAEMFDGFFNGYRYGRLLPVQIMPLVESFLESTHLEMNGESIFPVIEKNEFEIGQILTANFIFQQDSELEKANDLIVLKQCLRFPHRILPILTNNPNNRYADSLIIIAAKRDPEELYNYASAYNPLAKKIGKVNDTLVHFISTLARMKAGRQYFPFLDNLYRGKITIEQIDNATDSEITYYKLLVATQIDYAGRLQMGDTPVVMETLTNRLKQKAVEVFINEINGLHEERDAIRFKILDKLSGPELYYLAVLGETEMYTSSYVNGIYPKMFQNMKVPRSDTLLSLVNYDHFKKFIKVAANYNTLDNFLKRMEKENAVALMKAFVNNLDKTKSLEDAVDVADSYASIKDKELNTLILKEVEENFAAAKTKKAKTIYGILNTIFKSRDNAAKNDMFEKLGIPPVYYMPNSMLKDSAGRIIVQQFFYGDKDGETVFNSFIRQFKALGWKMTSAPEWVVMTSTGKGTPVSIYSNRPLDTEKDLDEKAQEALGRYLASKNMSPTVIIHRGHSYYTNSTIRQIPESAKVVFLGSCGGYNNLNDVLSICPTAHIISSKQVGSGLINLPLINAMAEDMRKGQNLNWPQIWKTLSMKLKGNDSWEDYVPPHKNLGAIFIMAYSKAEEEMFTEQN